MILLLLEPKDDAELGTANELELVLNVESEAVGLLVDEDSCAVEFTEVMAFLLVAELIVVTVPVLEEAMFETVLEESTGALGCIVEVKLFTVLLLMLDEEEN